MAEVVAQPGPSLGDVFAWLRANWLCLFAGAVVGLAAAGYYYKTAAPEYEAKIVVMPQGDSEADSRLGGLINQLGVGSLLGAGSSGEAATQRHLAIFKSRAFAERFIDRYSLMSILFADRWDEAAKGWKVDGRQPPTTAEGVRKIEEIRRIAEDRRAGLVTVTLRWQDPGVAARLANSLLDFANQQLREEVIAESETTTRYITEQIAQTQAVAVREALFRVLEEQMKGMTLARTRTEYAFRIIDPAQVPLRRDRVSPRLIPTAFSGLAGGCALGLLVSIAITARRRKA